MIFATALRIKIVESILPYSLIKSTLSEKEQLLATWACANIPNIPEHHMQDRANILMDLLKKTFMKWNPMYLSEVNGWVENWSFWIILRTPEAEMKTHYTDIDGALTSFRLMGKMQSSWTWFSVVHKAAGVMSNLLRTAFRTEIMSSHSRDTQDPCSMNQLWS